MSILNTSINDIDINVLIGLELTNLYVRTVLNNSVILHERLDLKLRRQYHFYNSDAKILSEYGVKSCYVDFLRFKEKTINTGPLNIYSDVCILSDIKKITNLRLACNELQIYSNDVFELSNNYNIDTNFLRLDPNSKEPAIQPQFIHKSYYNNRINEKLNVVYPGYVKESNPEHKLGSRFENYITRIGCDLVDLEDFEQIYNFLTSHGFETSNILFMPDTWITQLTHLYIQKKFINKDRKYIVSSDNFDKRYEIDLSQVCIIYENNDIVYLKYLMQYDDIFYNSSGF